METSTVPILRIIDRDADSTSAYPACVSIDERVVILDQRATGNSWGGGTLEAARLAILGREIAKRAEPPKRSTAKAVIEPISETLQQKRKRWKRRRKGK